MGTRSITDFISKDHDGDDVIISRLYRQYDGYPDGHGLELAEFLRNMTVVNGFTLDQKAPMFANGMGCLAAQVVAKLKNEIGNIYLEDPTPGDWTHVDYKYEVYEVEGEPHIACYGNGRLYDGPVCDYFTFIDNRRKED